MLYLQQAGIIGDYHVMLATASQTTDLGYLPYEQPPPRSSVCAAMFEHVLYCSLSHWQVWSSDV